MEYPNVSVERTIFATRSA